MLSRNIHHTHRQTRSFTFFFLMLLIQIFEPLSKQTGNLRHAGLKNFSNTLYFCRIVSTSFRDGIRGFLSLASFLDEKFPRVQCFLIVREHFEHTCTNKIRILCSLIATRLLPDCDVFYFHIKRHSDQMENKVMYINYF